MNGSLTSFTDIIDLWSNDAAFGREIAEEYGNVRQWRLNDSIPGRAFAAVVRAAHARGWFHVTHELLCSFAEAKHEQRRGVGA